MTSLESHWISPEEMILNLQENLRQHRENKYAFQVGLKDVDFKIARNIPDVGFRTGEHYAQSGSSTNRMTPTCISA